MFGLLTGVFLKADSAAAVVVEVQVAGEAASVGEVVVEVVVVALLVEAVVDAVAVVVLDLRVPGVVPRSLL